MSLGEVMALLMAGAALLALGIGFPVAFTLSGVALCFAVLGSLFGVFDLGLLGALPSRIFGIVTNQALIAVPLFVFMGVMLERSKVAEDLLEAMATLVASLRGGLALSVLAVGALLAASTGIVGATVATMGLISLPAMMKRGYEPGLAAGTVLAAGTLGQIIPPSIVLVLLGDQIATAYAEAQRSLGNLAPEPVSVGELFAGALVPGLLLVAMYAVYLLFVGHFMPSKVGKGPTVPNTVGICEPGNAAVGGAVRAIAMPGILIIAVLGSILAGVATPTEAASIGAVGAIFLAGAKLSRSGWVRRGVFGAGLALIALVPLTALVDTRLGRSPTDFLETAGSVLALMLTAFGIWGLGASLFRANVDGVLGAVCRRTMEITAMIFAILIGAGIFTLVFRGFGGDRWIQDILVAVPGGGAGAVLAVMVLIFVLGFFLDFVEILFVVVPLAAPVLLTHADPVWLGVMIALNLQTSFLTPPFGFALFYLRGVAPPSLKTADIYRGAMPFVIIQLLALSLLAVCPGLATWLPQVLLGYMPN